MYRRYRDEFMDILLEKGNTADDISRWAPRQFICPITQVRAVSTVVKHTAVFWQALEIWICRNSSEIFAKVVIGTFPLPFVGKFMGS